MSIKNVTHILGEIELIPAESRQALLEMGLPKSFLDKELKYWLVENSEVSCFEFDGLSALISFDYQDHLIKNGFLSIGSCPNGDLIAYNFKSTKEYPVVFISHEHEGLYNNGAIVWTPVSDSIRSFVMDANSYENFPCDYFDAKESGPFQIQYSFYQRVIWSPWVAVVPFSWMAYSMTVNKFTTARTLGFTVNLIYLALSLYNWWSSGRFQDYLYRPDDD